MPRLLRVIVFCAAAVFAVSSPVSAQQSGNAGADGRALRELLEEVRLLRQVLQTTSLVSVRANVLLARHKGHQERIEQLERQLTDARQIARDTENSLAQYAEEFSRIEEAATLESDPAKRAEKEEQLHQFTLMRTQLKRSIETQRERELELTNTIAQEQAKLDEIQRGLDSIEGELEALQKKVPGGGQ